jgi:hypothetical protein
VVFEGGCFMQKMNNQVVSLAEMKKRIFLIRNQRVMLDSDLAALYEVPTK